VKKTFHFASLCIRYAHKLDMRKKRARKRISEKTLHFASLCITQCTQTRYAQKAAQERG